MTTKPEYSTIQDVIDYEVKPALDEWWEDYDLMAIAEEAFEFVTNEDENDGVQVGNPYYVQRDDVDFWEVAQAHDLTAAEPLDR